MSKQISKITLFLSVGCLILGIRTNWHEYTFRKSSTATKAIIVSVDTKLKSGKALASVNYLLAYQRNYLNDTISHSTTQEYSIKEPLPSIEELKKNEFYIHYVPKNRSNQTSLKDRIYISHSRIVERDFHLGWFIRMLSILIFGYILNRSISYK